MKIRTFFYSLRQGLKNIWRNKMFSLASIATMTACIFLFGLFCSILINITYNIREAEDDVPMTVYFQETTTQETKDKLKEKIGGNDKVKDIKYISAEEAWNTFKDQYFASNPELADSFADDNPLAKSDHFEVFVKKIEEQKQVVEWIQKQEGIRDVKVSQVAANLLSNFNRLVGYASIAVISILLIVAIFLISNTVTIGISVRKEEIAIMKYIGATDFFVRAPFVIEGVLIGLFGAILPLIALYFLYEKAVSYIINKFGILNGVIKFLPPNEVFKYLLPAGLILGVGIGFIVSVVTTKKHLKV